MVQFVKLQNEGHHNMNEPSEQQNTEDLAKKSEVVAATGSPTVLNGGHKVETQKHTDISTAQHADTKLKAWIKDLWATHADRQIELILAAAITFFAAAQWITSCENNASTAMQANALINTASSMATAASGFAVSASSINTHMDEAVGKLQTQSDKMDDARKAAVATSDKALKATTDNFHLEQRPWVGLQDVRCDQCTIKIEPNKTTGEISGTLTIGHLFGVMTNTGKTPALNVVVRYGMEGVSISDPIPTWDNLEERIKKYSPDIRYRESVMPPNGTEPIELTGGISMGQRRSQLSYIVGKITYSDINGDEHTTMFCLVNGVGDASYFDCISGNEMK
jgi:hypothetical protein